MSPFVVRTRHQTPDSRQEAEIVWPDIAQIHLSPAKPIREYDLVRQI